MATGGTDRVVNGLGAGKMQWVPPFELVDESGVVQFAISATGVGARPLQKRHVTTGAKVGATAGAVVAAADNKNSLFRVPASQSGSTIVVPLDYLKVGDIITAYHLVGQIESAGGTVTVDAALRKQTAAAADLTDAAITGGDMTQLSVTADTIMSLTNTTKTLTTPETVGVDETFYLLITVTTAGSTDVDAQAVALTLTEA